MDESKRTLLKLLAAVPALGIVEFARAEASAPVDINAPRHYPKRLGTRILDCVIDASMIEGRIDPRIFGTNLEYIDGGDGFISRNPAHTERLLDLARDQGVAVWRFPGGTYSDYYDWINGTGPISKRPVTPHMIDAGRSHNRFGSPEFFKLLHATGTQGLITVNAGTGSSEEAAAWVAYANQAGNTRRMADGFKKPIGINLWEVGNELYLPGSPGVPKVGVTPEVYARRYLEFATKMRAADPSINLLAIGVAKSHRGPDTQYPDWSRVLLEQAAGHIDFISVHNAYFPMIYPKVGNPSVAQVYPALWAAPEAVNRSLISLERLIEKYQKTRRIGIAVTEWGTLFSLPRVNPYWFDHVKTLGSGVYIARLLQVFMSRPKVAISNYFKFVDRTFMGWIDYKGEPKVPYWVFELYAKHSGDLRVNARVDSPTYSVPALGIMYAEENVPEITVIASKRSSDGRLFVNFVNRSMSTIHRVKIELRGFRATAIDVLMVTGNEPTANNGRDIPPGMPYSPEIEPYTTAPANSIRIDHRQWPGGNTIDIPPFSIVTLVGSP